MCIAICKPKDQIIPVSHLEESFRRNSDGAGFAYAENNEIHIEKGFMDFDSFLEAYKPHKEKAAIVHFRITTHGETDQDNTHPFRVGKNMAMIHNGIINAIDCKDDPSRSDTYHFNTKILSQLYKRDSRFIFKDHYKELIREYVGYSKLVFLNNKGHFQIVNEQAGVWDEGVWYSNKSYEPWTKLPKKTNASYSVPKTTTKSGEALVLSQGCRVSIKMKNLEGTGTLMHFTGGLMAGVLIDGDERTSLLPLSALEPVQQGTTDNSFNVGDWVYRVDREENDIYEVTGTAKHSTWIQKLNDLCQPFGSTYVVHCNKLIGYQDWSTV